MISLVREKLEKIAIFFQVLRGCGRHAHNLDNVPLSRRVTPFDRRWAKILATV